MRMNKEDEELMKMVNPTLKRRETILFFLIVVINGLKCIVLYIGLDTCARGRWRPNNYNNNRNNNPKKKSFLIHAPLTLLARSKMAFTNLDLGAKDLDTWAQSEQIKCKFGCTSFSPLSLSSLFFLSLSWILLGFHFMLWISLFFVFLIFLFFWLSNLLDLGFCKINVISFRSKKPKTKVDWMD